MNKMDQKELWVYRREMFGRMEEELKKYHPSEEDSVFYYHSSEDRIVLSHALFWVMTRTLKGRVRTERYLLLLRQYEEEMLEDYLTEDEQFPEMLRYCNIIYEMLPYMLNATHDIAVEKDARKLAAISVIAGGYAGDMDEDLCNELLDDIDFYYNKVKCRKIEMMLPQLNQFVENEMRMMMTGQNVYKPLIH